MTPRGWALPQPNPREPVVKYGPAHRGCRGRGSGGYDLKQGKKKDSTAD